MIERLDPQQAAQRLGECPETVFLDVRSTAEFATGHVPGAINIPLMEPDATGFMRPNPDFARVVQAVIPTDAPVIVGCKAGPRSDHAARIMDQLGYDHIADMVGGFLGATDQRGEPIVSGWRHFDLPVATEPGEGCTYSDLRQRATKND